MAGKFYLEPVPKRANFNLNLAGADAPTDCNNETGYGTIATFEDVEVMRPQGRLRRGIRLITHRTL